MTISGIGWLLLAAPTGMLLYAYVGYPVALVLATWLRPARPGPGSGDVGEPWPTLTITVPCYNEENSIADTLEGLLRLDYPPERRRILVISDASTDDTDAIVASFAPRGVELLRLPERRGKTGAENAAGPVLHSDIVLNTDATIRLLPDAPKRLVEAFQDPTVGVASGRDISVGQRGAATEVGEAGYVGYEMWIRSLETRLGSIVGASGCCYAIRRSLYDGAFPEALSRDFAACLIAKEHGFRSVSVDTARCLVPRAGALPAEFRRKVRTMARGLDTLAYKRHLLNPVRHGWFAFALLSHKLSRWLTQLLLPLGLAGWALLAISSPVIAVVGGVGLGFAAVVALAGWYWPGERDLPRWLAAPAFVWWANLAGVVAWGRFILGRRAAIWEPTRRRGKFNAAPHLGG